MFSWTSSFSEKDVVKMCKILSDMLEYEVSYEGYGEGKYVFVSKLTGSNYEIDFVSTPFSTQQGMIFSLGELSSVSKIAIGRSISLNL
jgi:hypothetical protein